jgi:hypothetical protein
MEALEQSGPTDAARKDPCTFALALDLDEAFKVRKSMSAAGPCGATVGRHEFGRCAGCHSKRSLVTGRVNWSPGTVYDPCVDGHLLSARRANPSKGGDAKLPGYRAERRHVSGAAGATSDVTRSAVPSLSFVATKPKGIP